MKTIKYWLLSVLMSLTVGASRAQSTEVQQLLLNATKLGQLKNILRDMKKGYDILTSGYNTIKGISKGNFSIHDAFLQGLLKVSPSVRKYKRIADIVALQKQIVREYRWGYERFKNSGTFSAQELDYFANVYTNLVDKSMRNIEELILVVTSSKLRMSDDERIGQIDDLYGKTKDLLAFLNYFNDEVTVMEKLKEKEKFDIKGLENIYLPKGKEVDNED
ncbi:MAG: TerB family tellurite resistance protein [Sphingobacterium sp.]|jgi:hypothetical protein|nr:TerB family tellurite resistance protein [Sphingobacterium sp.]